MRQHFRGVVWPRAAINGPQGPIYRYVIVGILATDGQLGNLDLSRVKQYGLGSTTFLDGGAPGLAEALEEIPQPRLTPDQANWLRGDASEVLLSLSELALTNESGND